MRNEKNEELQNKLKELERKHKLHCEQKILEDIKIIRNEINDLATQAIKKIECFLNRDTMKVDLNL